MLITKLRNEIPLLGLPKRTLNGIRFVRELNSIEKLKYTNRIARFKKWEVLFRFFFKGWKLFLTQNTLCLEQKLVISSYHRLEQLSEF